MSEEPEATDIGPLSLAIVQAITEFMNENTLTVPETLAALEYVHACFLRKYSDIPPYKLH